MKCKNSKRIRFEICEGLDNDLDEYLDKIALQFCLFCPNCDREMPNKSFLTKDNKCKWCSNDK